MQHAYHILQPCLTEVQTCPQPGRGLAVEARTCSLFSLTDKILPNNAHCSNPQCNPTQFDQGSINLSICRSTNTLNFAFSSLSLSLTLPPAFHTLQKPSPFGRALRPLCSGCFRTSHGRATSQSRIVKQLTVTYAAEELCCSKIQR